MTVLRTPSGRFAPRAIVRKYPRTHLYYISILSRKALAGGEADNIPGAAGLAGIALDETHLYHNGIGSIFRRDASGTNTVTLQEGLDRMLGTDVDDTHVYWSDIGAGLIQRTRKDGSGLAETLASKQAGARAATVVGDRVYWATSNAVMSCSRTGGNVAEVATNLSAPFNVRADAEYIYWIDDSVLSAERTLAPSRPSTTMLAADGISSLRKSSSITVRPTVRSWYGSRRMARGRRSSWVNSRESRKC